MMRRKISICICFCLLAGVLFGCSKDKPNTSPTPDKKQEGMVTPSPTPKPIKNPEGDTVSGRFNPPTGYVRVASEAGSFAAFLQSHPLKEDGAPVLLFDGTERADAPQAAVLRLDISKTSNQQGPRALVRLRAEYLFAAGQTSQINYQFLSGFVFPFDKWCEGYRVEVDGKKVEWVLKDSPANDYAVLLSYLNTLFAYSNTSSLRAELQAVADIQAGDIFINGEAGAVMVMDVARAESTGEVVFLLAQSPSPTQEIYILNNSADSAISPWYSASDLPPLVTPTGSFTMEDLRRFNELPTGEAPAAD